MNNSERRACTNKLKHANSGKAYASMRATLAHHQKKGSPIVTGLSVYKCQYCKSWHVGRSKAKGIDWSLVD